MSLKRRLLKYALILIGVFLFTGYFAFSTFLFSPLESRYGADLSTLVPRDVNFFFSKAQLQRDFDGFPKLAIADAFAATEGGEILLESEEFLRWKVESGVEQALRDFESAMAEAPVAIDPLSVIGGEDLALAGYFTGDDIGAADWALYARGNWIAKLGIALLDYPGLLGLEGAELSAVSNEGVISLSGTNLERPLHVSRVLDVIVVSTVPSLVQAAQSLDAVKGQDSYGNSARYFDHIQNKLSGEQRELEVFVDLRALSENKNVTGRFPDVNSDEFGEAFLGRLFQTGILREVSGVVDFPAGIALDLHGGVSTETLSVFQKRFYRTRGFSRSGQQPMEFARFCPADAGLFVYLHGSIGELLRQAYDSSERALQDNLDSLVNSVWGYPDTQPLIEDLNAAFHGRIGFVMRNYDYPRDPTGPPNDGSEVPAWCLILHADAAAKITEVHDRVNANSAQFGLQGATPDERGIYTEKVSGGFVVYEYWSQFVPGTGHIATVAVEEYFLISNSYPMLGQMLKTFYEGGSSNPRLSDYGPFVALYQSGLENANILGWLNPSGMAPFLRKSAEQWARDEVEIDWSVMRPQIDRQVLSENYPEWDYNNLTPEQETKLEMLSSPARDAYQKSVYEEQIPSIYAKYERNILVSEMFSAVLMELDLDDKKIELVLRCLLPLSNP